MRQIELNEGYMICVTCKGYIEAGTKTPSCDCMGDELSEEEAITVNA